MNEVVPTQRHVIAVHQRGKVPARATTYWRQATGSGCCRAARHAGRVALLLLTELAHVVRCGRKVGLAASSRDVYVLVRGALMLLLDDSGGRA